MKLPLLFLILQVTDEDESPRRAKMTETSCHRSLKQQEMWVSVTCTLQEVSNLGDICSVLMVTVRFSRRTRRAVSRALLQNTEGAFGLKSWPLRTSQLLALELDDSFLNWILVSCQVFVDRHFLMTTPSGLCGLWLHLLRDMDSVLLFKPTSWQLLQRSNRATATAAIPPNYRAASFLQCFTSFYRLGNANRKGNGPF